MKLRSSNQKHIFEKVPQSSILVTMYQLHTCLKNAWRSPRNFILRENQTNMFFGNWKNVNVISASRRRDEEKSSRWLWALRRKTKKVQITRKKVLQNNCIHHIHSHKLKIWWSFQFIYKVFKLISKKDLSWFSKSEKQNDASSVKTWSTMHSRRYWNPIFPISITPPKHSSNRASINTIYIEIFKRMGIRVHWWLTVLQFLQQRT